MALEGLVSQSQVPGVISARFSLPRRAPELEPKWVAVMVDAFVSFRGDEV